MECPTSFSRWVNWETLSGGAPGLPAAAAPSHARQELTRTGEIAHCLLDPAGLAPLLPCPNANAQPVTTSSADTAAVAMAATIGERTILWCRERSGKGPSASDNIWLM